MQGERRWLDLAPGKTAWAKVTAPARPSLAERNPAAVHWRELLVDPDGVGVITGSALTTLVDLYWEDARFPWTLPLSGTLPSPLAWHPLRPLVAGLIVLDDFRVHPWIADYRDRTVTVHEQVQAATSCTSFTSAPPLAWCCSTGLVLLVPPAEAAAPTAAKDPDAQPVLLEARGPAFPEFTPGLAELVRNIGAQVAEFDVETQELTPRSEPLLARSVIPKPETRSVTVEHADRVAEHPVEARFHWSATEVELRHRSTPDVAFGTPTDGRVEDEQSVPGPDARTDQPDPSRRRIATRYSNSWLTVPQDAASTTVLWIRACEQETPVPDVPVPSTFHGTPHPVADLDLHLHWPGDATVDMLHEQLSGVLTKAVRLLTEQSATRKIIVGGHSFGATLALYALANVAGFVAGIAHSGCYNRTGTLTGFHYERRSHWQVPEIYRAFSAVHFADRLAGPVLLAHGTADTNPATTPDQAVEFYRAVVAAGGHARIALFPKEGHNFHYRETHTGLRAEHGSWLARWDD